MTIRLLAAALAFFASVQALGQTEIILDNGSAAFATAGTWPASTSVSGFIGSNYQTHEANGAPPGAIAVDNTDPGFSVTGTWISSTAVSGYLGSNYQHHYANGEPPTSVVADNLAGSFSGTWPTSTSVGGYYATNYQHHAAGTGTSSFTWTLNVPSSGSYEAYARWTQHPNRATNAKYTVSHAGGADVVTVNQEVGGGSWQLLGTYSFNAGATTVSLSDDADGYVIADAVMLAPPGAAPNTATWSATIPSSGSYEVFARWTQHPNRASNAKYTVNHAGGSTQVIVNQMAGGGSWSSLGTFSFDAGSASISLTDQADGYVIADAVMFLPPGSSPNSATWTTNVAQAGQYEVYAQWTQHANRATDATYTVSHAGGSTPVAVNQQANGGVWNLLGTFTLSPGPAHNVTLTDQANGYVIADAIRLVPVAIQAEQKLYFVHADHLNTPRLVADATGTTVWRWDQQEPFGNNPADEDPDANSVAFDLPLRLPGQRYDAETGLHYNYYRDFDPSLGIYKQSDIIGLRGGLNTYAYGYASPLRYLDFTGLEVLIVGHLAAGPLGRITSPNSYHLALYLDPDYKCSCPGDWPRTLGAQKSGKNLVATPNYPGDALQNASFIQTVPTPPGMTDCEFINQLMSTAASYGGNLQYSSPDISLIPGKTDGVMGAGQYNSNSFVSGTLQGAGVVPPSLNTNGAFQAPGFANPVPINFSMP